MIQYVMAAETIVLARKDLYDQVWTTPMRVLAGKYGLSDVGLAKICKKYGIPRPSRGWWAQKQAGYKVEQTPLPKGDEDTTVRIWVDHDRASRRDHVRGIVAGTRRKKTPREKFAVLQTLTDPHPLIATVADALIAVEPGANRLVLPPPHCLNIYASPERRDRALRVIDTLIKVLEAKGHEVRVLRASTSAIVEGIRILILITEDLKAERLHAREHNLDGPYEFGYNRYVRDVASGRLCIRIGSVDDNLRAPVRRLWRDTDRQRLEDVLYAIVQGLEKIAAVMRADERKKQQEDYETGDDI